MLFSNLTVWVLGAVLAALVCTVAATVVTCVWLYRDAPNYGQRGVLWVLVALLCSPVVALLLYLIFVRREPRAPCPQCLYPAPASARYCERCGAALPPYEPRPRRLGRLGRWAVGLIIAIFAAMLAAIGGLVALTVAPELAGTASFMENWEVNTGWVLMNLENHRDGRWIFTIDKASEGWHTSDTFRVDDPEAQYLVVDVGSEGGALLLSVQQGDERYEQEIGGLQEPLRVPLAAYEAGKVKVRLTLNGAEQVRGSIWVE